MSKTFAITPVHDLLLRGGQDMPIGLYHLHLATAEQLTRLHYKPGMLKTVSKRLKVLVDNGIIQADCIPTKLFKSPYYYTIATKGMRYLQDIGLDIEPSYRASKEISDSYLHLRHTLELNDVLIAALRLKYCHPNYYLSRYIHERSLKRQPYKANGITLIPDGFLDLRDRTSNRAMCLILEIDRGTEQQEHFKRRITAYKTFYAADGCSSMFGIKAAYTAFVGFVGAKRLQYMRDWTNAALQDSPQLRQFFLFADLPKPLEPNHLLFERRWYTLTASQPIALLEG
jgi:Replication-relaxation